MMSTVAYFDRIAIVHLPQRTDRYRSIKRELKRVGVDIAGSKVQIPHAPRPEDLNGFSKRAVYGNFLSHLEILRDALSHGVRSVLVLEDDALFHRRLGRNDIVSVLEQTPWDMCYLGHTLKASGRTRGLIPYRPEYGYFYQAHCYAVHQRCLPALVAYLEETLINPPGHPRGGRMYIDGALAHFRQQHPQRVVLIANPSLSRQKGCSSSIADANWYDSIPAVRHVAQLSRSCRDELWRWRPVSLGAS